MSGTQTITWDRLPRQWRWIAGWLLSLAYLGGCAGSYTGLDADGHPPLSERETRAGIAALLGPEDFATYDALPDSLKSEWMRYFWREHDPTPTTSENEFQREHWRRVRYSLYYFSNPLGPLPWDDRGEVYIRYGEPSERTYRLDEYWDRRGTLSARGSRLQGLSAGAAQERDFSPDATGSGPSETDNAYQLKSNDSEVMFNPREFDGEIWDYYQHGLTFQFQDEDELGIFILVPYSDGLGPSREFGDFVQAKITAVDLQPAIYMHDYGAEHLEYALDFARFRSEGRLFTLDVNLGYPLAELARGGPDSTQISLRRAVVIRDDSLREVAADLGVVTRRVGAAGLQQQLMVEQKNFELPPGAYQLSVCIEDLYSGKKGIYRKNLRLPEFASREVQEISDIELASFVWSIYEPGSPYVKSNRLVMPLPSHVYMQNQPIAFYYEVYNLARNAGDSAIYNVEYEILDPEAKNVFYSETRGVFTSLERDVYQFGSIDKAGLQPGEYLLSINVADQLTNKEKRTLTRFKVIRSTETAVP
jgi:GWxTD domain-containing protein